MLFKELKNMGVGLDKDIAESKAYPICSVCNKEDAARVVNILRNHGYDLSALSLSSLKLFSLSPKEVKEEKDIEGLNATLTKIDELKLKQVFVANLNVESLRPEVVARIEYCVTNGIPFLYEGSNALIAEVYDAVSFAEYTAKASPIEKVATAPKKEEALTIDTKNPVYQVTGNFDAEDMAVRSEIIRTLLEIKENNTEDFTLNFLITSIIANIDSAISNDAKRYRENGLRHLIENAIQGVALDSEMQYVVESKILSAFPDVNLNAERRG